MMKNQAKISVILNLIQNPFQSIFETVILNCIQELEHFNIRVDSESAKSCHSELVSESASNIFRICPKIIFELNSKQLQNFSSERPLKSLSEGGAQPRFPRLSFQPELSQMQPAQQLCRCSVL